MAASFNAMVSHALTQKGVTARRRYYKKRYPDADPDALIAVRELEKKLFALKRKLKTATTTVPV